MKKFILFSLLAFLLIIPSNSVFSQGITKPSVSDVAYDSSWDGVTTIAPSKNAVYDKIETTGWTDDGTTVRLTTSTDNVGIGTTAPGTKLHLSQTGDSLPQLGIFLDDYSNTVDYPFVSFRQARGNLSIPAAVQINDYMGELNAYGHNATDFVYSSGITFSVDGTPTASYVPGRIELWTSDGIGIYERMRIDNAGNVGIGTTTPSSSLVINKEANDITTAIEIINPSLGTSADSFIHVVVGSVPSISETYLGTAGVNNLTYGVGGESYLWQDQNYDIFFATDATERMRIKGNGNVGIGTAAPSALLNLKGTLSSALTGTVAVTNLSTAIVGTLTLFTTELAVGDAIKIGTEIFTVSVITDNLNLTLDSAYQGTTASGLTAYRDSTLFAIDNGDAVNKLTVTKSGNVGIGTTTPGAALHIVSEAPEGFIEIDNYGINYPCYVGQRARGTIASPLILQNGDIAFELYAGAYDGVSFPDLGYIHFIVDGTPGENDMPGRIDFYTTSDGTNTSTLKMTIKNDGNVGIGTASPSSLLEVAGAIETAFVAKTASYTVTISDSVLTSDATAAAVTFTLPTAVGIAGRRYTFKRIDASANNTIIDASGTETIDGALTKTLGAQYSAITIISNGANWIIESQMGTIS